MKRTNCRFHYLCWVNRLLAKLQQQLDEVWDEFLDDVRPLLDELLPLVGKRTYRLYRQHPTLPASTTNRSLHWPGYRNRSSASATFGIPIAPLLSKPTPRPPTTPPKFTHRLCDVVMKITKLTVLESNVYTVDGVFQLHNVASHLLPLIT